LCELEQVCKAIIDIQQARQTEAGHLGSLLFPTAGEETCLAERARPGLPGLVCAKLGASSVVLTDLVELLPLMVNNIAHNFVEGTCRAETLDWLTANVSPLAAVNREAEGPLDVVLAADVVYVEEQEPLMGALLALMAPGHTQLVLAYKNRNPGDREYLNSRILPRMEEVREMKYSTPEDGMTELFICRLRQRDT